MLDVIGQLFCSGSMPHVTQDAVHVSGTMTSSSDTSSFGVDMPATGNDKTYTCEAGGTATAKPAKDTMRRGFATAQTSGLLARSLSGGGNAQGSPTGRRGGTGMSHRGWVEGKDTRDTSAESAAPKKYRAPAGPDLDWHLIGRSFARALGPARSAVAKRSELDFKSRAIKSKLKSFLPLLGIGHKCG